MPSPSYCLLLHLSFLLILTLSFGNNNYEPRFETQLPRSSLLRNTYESAGPPFAFARFRSYSRLRLRGGNHDRNEKAGGLTAVTNSTPIDEELSKLELEQPDETDAEIEALIAKLEGNLEGVTLDDEVSPAYEAELQSLKRDAELFPSHLPSLYNYARFLQKHKHIDLASKVYETCTHCDVKEAWKEGLAHTYCNYGLLLHEQKNLSGAEHFYKAALSINPNHVSTLNNYGKLLEGSEKTSSRQTIKVDLDGAESLYSRSLAACPDHIPTLVNFAYFKEKVCRLFPQVQRLQLLHE